MNRAAHRRLRPWLIGANAALGVGLIALHVHAAHLRLPPLPDPPAIPVHPVTLAPVSVTPTPRALRGAYALAPLFTPDRAPDPAVAARTDRPETGTPVLTGVVLAPGEAYALIASGTAPPKALTIGKAVPGSRWTVQRIAPHHVVLSDSSGPTLRLPLRATTTLTRATTPLTAPGASADIAATPPPASAHPAGAPHPSRPAVMPLPPRAHPPASASVPPASPSSSDRL